MSETASTESASEGHSTTADAAGAGSPLEGSEGTQGAGVRSDAGDTGLEARVRSEQGRADRAEARAKELEAQLASLQPSKDTESEPPASPALTAADFHAALQVFGSAQAVREEFPEANPSLFADLSRYGSIEALKAAAARSHADAVSEKERLSAEVDAKYKKLYAEKFGELPEEEGPPSGGEKVEGVPTIAQFRKMSLSELDAYEKENPGVFRKVLAESSPQTLMKAAE